MSKRNWEDFTQGSVAEYGPRLVTRDEIIAFATEFDPQPMHLDEAAGRASMLGGLAASGWHMCSIMMRIAVDGFLGNSSSMGSPGVDEARWVAPLRPGDRVSVRATVLETRASASRPQMGFVKFLLEMFNQDGVQLMTLTTSLMIARRQNPAAE
ncbi:MAG: MaoC family dehydratase [Xanthobacteraceae bacterium]